MVVFDFSFFHKRYPIKVIPAGIPAKNELNKAINKSVPLNMKGSFLMNIYNPIISSLYISGPNGEPTGVLLADTKSGSITLSFLLIGFPIDKELNTKLSITISTVKEIINNDVVDLDLDRVHIPQNNIYEDNYFGTTMSLSTVRFDMPKGEYINFRLDLILDSQILSSKNTTAFVV